MSINIRFNIVRGSFSLNIETAINSQGVTAIFGPSGSGKTTLLRAMAGLDNTPGNLIKVNNTTWQDGSRLLPVHKRNIGYVFQEPSLFSHINVRENIYYGVSRKNNFESGKNLLDVLQLLDIEGLLMRMPSQLSGGEQQRVAIARALAPSPSMLLLDEPLAALGDAQKAEILPYLESLSKHLDIPIIYVSHSVAEIARLAQHMIILENGLMTTHGKVNDVFTSLDLPLAHEVGAESIIEATVSSYESEFSLANLAFPGGDLVVASAPLAVEEKVRVQVLARDVSITLQQQRDTSILNIIPVSIGRIVKEKNAQVTLRLIAGATPLLARITLKSCQDLSLKEGDVVYAQIKTVAILS